MRRTALTPQQLLICERLREARFSLLLSATKLGLELKLSRESLHKREGLIVPWQPRDLVAFRALLVRLSEEARGTAEFIDRLANPCTPTTPRAQ